MVQGVRNPLIKDKFGNVESSDNYRPIMSSSVLLKTLEIAKVENLLCTNVRQMGFKRNSSAHLAYLLLKEVSLNYVTRKTPVYAAFLDLSKAFDNVSHVKLFKILLRRGFDPGIIVHLIQNWYGRQEVMVKFNGSHSEGWIIKNGVRQGGILYLHTCLHYILMMQLTKYQ
jgi:hypothetical protein